MKICRCPDKWHELSDPTCPTRYAADQAGFTLPLIVLTVLVVLSVVLMLMVQ